MRFLRQYDAHQRARIRVYGQGIKNQVSILPHYEAVRVLESKGAELQKERDVRKIERREIASHVCDYWGLKPDIVRDGIIQQIESSNYFTRFLVPRINGHGPGRAFSGVPIAYLHTSLRTADYAALLGYDEDRQKAFFEELKKGIPCLLFAPSPLKPYERGISKPLEHVPFEEQVKQRGLV